MSKTTNATFIAEKNKEQNTPILLFQLHDYDGANSHLYFTNYDSAIVYPTSGGQTYTRFPIKFETIEENTQGQVDAVRIRLANASRLIQSYLEQYDLRGKKVTITMVWANQLADADANIKYIYYIDSYVSNLTNVTFVCTTKYDVIDRKLPGGIYLRGHCRYKKFKDPNTCGYIGAETECNRTKTRCKELANFSRFGGFPSVPLRTLYVV